MSSIFHIMQEEHQRLKAAEKAYVANIDRLPQGAPRIKRIHNRPYLYLAKREGARVIDRYIGAADSPKAQAMLANIQKRRKLAKLLKEVRSNIKDVKKVLRGKI